MSVLILQKQVMFFSRTIKARPIMFFFNNEQLDFVDNHKQLGITLRDSGRGLEYIDSIIHSASFRINASFKIQTKTQDIT